VHGQCFPPKSRCRPTIRRGASYETLTRLGPDHFMGRVKNAPPEMSLEDQGVDKSLAKEARKR